MRTFLALKILYKFKNNRVKIYKPGKNFAYFMFVIWPFYIKVSKNRNSNHKILPEKYGKDPVAEKVQTPFIGLPIT